MAHRTPDERRWLHDLETARFGVWDLEPQLDSVHYAPPWKARLGFPRLHAADGTSFWRCRVHPADLDGMLGALRAHLDGDADSYTMRFRLRSNGSGYRTMISRGRVIERGTRGEALRMVGTMADLTPRPLAPVRHGLAAEDPRELPSPSRAPLHAALGLGAATAGADASRLLDQVHDLLDLAQRDLAALR